MNEVDWILKRRSIRKFSGQAPSDEQITKMLEAAMAAPSALNLKPWKFIVVQDQERLAELRKALPFGKMMAPCAIVVCGDLRWFKKPAMERFWVQDCSAATQNILLAAVSLRLGAVWCGVHPISRLEKPVGKTLGIPEGVVPLNVIFIGTPAEEKPARTQYSDKNVYSDKFGHPWKG
ncbi:MAG: nitroreductase family protein [Anaerolineaceae bacterium]|nr:nitroreductase family protein [Anaerolineaceae bacterium]